MEVERGKREIISSLSPFCFCSSRLNESHKGDNSSGHLSGTFAFAHGTSPICLFPLLRRDGKEGHIEIRKGCDHSVSYTHLTLPTKRIV